MSSSSEPTTGFASHVKGCHSTNDHNFVLDTAHTLHARSTNDSKLKTDGDTYSALLAKVVTFC